MSINERRFRETFEALTADGRTPRGGLNRPALSNAHIAARKRFAALIADSGFDGFTDGAGNLSARWQAAQPDAPTLLLGSHLDSVRNGGRFDGTLGVAAAFEALQSLRDLGETMPVNLEVIDFTDEEGTWVSLMGSRALTGQLDARDLEHPHGGLAAFDEALARADLTRSGILRASRSDEPFQAYLELHIEQGTRLESTGTDIGVVTGMVGIYKYAVTFLGVANHAGTTPMDQRRDAAQGAAAFAMQVRSIVMERFTDCVANVGNMAFKPGAYNIVPRTVVCSMELRSSDADRARALEAAFRDAAQAAAAQYGLKMKFDYIGAVHPRTMDAGVRQAFSAAAASLGLSSRNLPSLAGHDAQNMALLGPAGLIFVPSKGGYSHSAREYTRWDDCVRGCRTLFEASRRLLNPA